MMGLWCDTAGSDTGNDWWRHETVLRSRERKSASVVGTAVLVPAADAGRDAGDVGRAQDVVVLDAASRRQGLPAAQRPRLRRLRHDPVLRAQCLPRSQVAPSSRLLRTYTRLPINPQKKTLGYNFSFFAAIHGSVRVRTPPRRSDMVMSQTRRGSLMSTGWCQFFTQKNPAGFCPRAAKREMTT